MAKRKATQNGRASGGARAVARKNAAREAARKRVGDYQSQWRDEVESLGPPPGDADKGHAWLARTALKLVWATLNDSGLPPEQQRRDAMKQIEQASKVLDPAKLSERIEALEQAEQEMRDARDVAPATTGSAGAEMDLI